MSDLPLPNISPDNPENKLSKDARHRIGQAVIESELLTAQTLNAIELRWQAEAKPDDIAFWDYLSLGQAHIDFIESRLSAARMVLRVEAEEYGKLGLPGREFREIMRDLVEAWADSREFSHTQRAALEMEFVWLRSQTEPAVSDARKEAKPSAAERVRAFMDRKGLSDQAFARMIGMSVRTVASAKAGEPLGKQARILVAKALGILPEDLFE